MQCHLRVGDCIDIQHVLRSSVEANTYTFRVDPACARSCERSGDAVLNGTRKLLTPKRETICSEGNAIFWEWSIVSIALSIYLCKTKR